MYIHSPSQNRQSIWRTRNTTMYIQRCAGQEKTVLVLSFAYFCQLLEIPELADGSSPHGEEVVV